MWSERTAQSSSITLLVNAEEFGRKRVSTLASVIGWSYRLAGATLWAGIILSVLLTSSEGSAAFSQPSAECGPALRHLPAGTGPCSQNSRFGRQTTATCTIDAAKPASSLAARLCCSLIRLYQRLVSPVGASACQMWPSCSAYGYEAFRRYGFLLGVMLTSDRLMRDNFSARGKYPLVRRDGRWLLADPLDENTWWWHKRGRKVVGRKAS